MSSSFWLIVLAIAVAVGLFVWRNLKSRIGIGAKADHETSQTAQVRSALRAPQGAAKPRRLAQTLDAERGLIKIGDKVEHRARPDVGVGEVIEVNDDLCTVEFANCRFSGLPLETFATIEKLEKERREREEQERREKEQKQQQKLAEVRAQEATKIRRRFLEEERRREELAKRKRAKENAEKNLLRLLRQQEIPCFWYMTHKYNLHSILKNGILNHDDAYRLETNHVDISDPEVQKRRETKEPHFKRTIHSYAPLYINPQNPMLYVRRHLRNDLLIIEVKPSVLFDSEYLISDGNAASPRTKFYRSIEEIDKLPWDVLKANYWKGYEDGKRKRCAELLVFPKVEPQHISVVHCYSRVTKESLGNCGRDVRLSPKLFF